MTLDDHPPADGLTREARRNMLCAFADRMLVKVTSMDDPEDMPGIERAVRVAAVIERIYSRCDRAEAHAPDPKKLEAEHARHRAEAVKARVSLADTLKWGEERRSGLGKWWEAAAPAAVPALAQPVPPLPARDEARKETAEIAPTARPVSGTTVAPDDSRSGISVRHVDYTDAILKARADMGLATPGAPPCALGKTASPNGGKTSAKLPSEDSSPRIRSCDMKWPPP